MSQDNLQPTVTDNTKGKSFLTHLEGLRGVAIILVILFHVGTVGMYSPLSLPGGYVGVEMFLVMSGYLLALGFCKKEIGAWGYAKKKVLRLFWPVAVVCIGTLLLALLSMDAEDICTAANNAVAALCGYTNIMLSESSTGYFAEETSFNPLFHTWYVAVTVQLYVWAYFVYLAVRRFPKWGQVVVLVLLAAGSYAWGHCHEWRASVIRGLDLPEWMGAEGSMYYSTLARLWEPICGAGVLLLPRAHKALASILVLAALVGTGYAVYLANEYSIPLAVATSMLLIKYTPVSVLNRSVDNNLLRFVGRISFSLYLVHIPLMVSYKCYTMIEWDVQTVILLLEAVLAVGYVVYRYVEKANVRLWCLAIVWCVALGGALWLKQTEGLKTQLHAKSNAISEPVWEKWSEEKNASLYNGLNRDIIVCDKNWMKFCRKASQNITLVRIGDTKVKPNFVLIGDSHAQHYFPGLDCLGQGNKMSGVYLASIYTPFWNRELKRTSRTYFCNRAKTEALFHWLKQQPDIKYVFIAQLWTRTKALPQDWDLKRVAASEQSGLAALREYCVQLRKIQKMPVLMAPIPYFKAKKPIRYMRHLLRVEPEKGASTYTDCVVSYDKFEAEFGNMIRYMAALEKEGLCRVLYPHKNLFTNNTAHMMNANHIVYHDHNHLTAQGSISLLWTMKRDIQKILTGK